MGEDRVERRTILGAGVGLLASLTGCSGLFIEPEATTTPSGGASTSTPTETPTATQSPTTSEATTDEPAPTATATATPMPSDAVEIRSRQLAVGRTELEQFAIATYRFDVENTSNRTIRDIEFRVRVRYEHEEYSRIVATAYPRFWFDDGDDNEGLETDETETVIGRLRFERDGRAEESTAVDRFSLELAIRRIRYR